MKRTLIAAAIAALAWPMAPLAGEYFRSAHDGRMYERVYDASTNSYRLYEAPGYRVAELPVYRVYDAPVTAARVIEAPAYYYTYTTRTSGISTAYHSGGGTLADEHLAAAVASALSADPRMDGATVTVASNRGQVMLSGSAKDQGQAYRAEQIARSVAGVTAVSGTLDPLGG